MSVRLIATIGAPSAIAAFFTARSATDLDPASVKAAIGVALLITAAFMLRRVFAAPAAASTAAGSDGQTSDSAEQSRGDSGDPPGTNVPAEVAVGGLLGAFAGLVGLLMGTLRLPLMLRLGAAPARAIGTNLAIGSLTGVFASVATVMEGSIDWLTFAVVTPATMLGAYLGATATGRLEKRTLRSLIAITLIAVGLWMISEIWR